jgi:hypothetical protein
VARQPRAYWGKYDDSTETSLANSQKSKAFVKLTRHKTNGWAARLSDLLFPTDEKNWGIQPTPLPELAKAAKVALAAVKESVDGANAADQAGNAEAADLLKQQADAYAQHHALTQEETERPRKPARRWKRPSTTSSPRPATRSSVAT